MKRGSHKRLMRRRQERGGWGGGQGQMSRSQKEKHIAFHQPAEKEVIHNSVDTIQPRMYALGVRCDHAATSRQVKKRKKCHFPPSYLTAQDRITDSGGHGGGVGVRGKDKKDDINRAYLWRCSHIAPGTEQLGWYSQPQNQKSTVVLWQRWPHTSPLLLRLPSFFPYARPPFPFDSLFCSPPLSWHPNRPSGLEVSCGQSCGERLTLQD